MRRLPGEWPFLLGAVLLPLLLVANAVVTYRDVQALVAHDRQLLHTYRVLNTAETLLGLVRDAETGVRGYVITGERRFLEPYLHAVPRIGPLAERLDSLVADSPVQRARVVRLREHAEERLGYLYRAALARENEGFEAARAIVQGGGGKTAMDNLRATASQLRAYEEALLVQRTGAALAAERRAALTFAVTTALALGLLVGFLALLRRLLRAQARVAEELEDRRVVLEAQVRARTRELEAANAELRAAAEALRRSHRELEDFTFVASHDLQEPLRKVQLFGDRLARRHGPALPEAARADLVRVTEAATRMRRLVEGLLAYARVGRDGSSPRPVPLGDVVAGALGELEADLHRTGARVTVGPLPVVEGHPDLLRQLVRHLLANALAFRRAGVTPEVDVRAEPAEDPDRVRVVVADNGRGFEPHYAERIFTPFERVHRDAVPGTGLGLATCRRIVEHHGGTITAHGTPGVGATFAFTLPLSALRPSSRAFCDDDSAR